MTYDVDQVRQRRGLYLFTSPSHPHSGMWHLEVFDDTSIEWILGDTRYGKRKDPAFSTRTHPDYRFEPLGLPRKNLLLLVKDTK
jgi:hypothetical protein